MYTNLRPLVVVSVLVVGVVLPGGPANAATGATLSSYDAAHIITYTAGDGQRNDVTLSVSDPVTGESGPEWVYTVHDVVPITPGQGCYLPDLADATSASCRMHAGDDFHVDLTLHLGDLADRLTSGPLVADDTTTTHGGPGNDVVTVADSVMSWAYGEDGDDVLTVKGAAWGGNGNDVLKGVGAMGEAGDDILLGTDDAVGYDRLIGGPGNDRITAWAGSDIVAGGSGNDRILAGKGNDWVFADSGNDVVFGGKGNDVLRGGKGDDVMYGNSGDDHLMGNFGCDRLSGGPGKDKVQQ